MCACHARSHGFHLRRHFRREWVARGYNIERWTEMPRGGHFAAAEEPELLAGDIAEFVSGLGDGKGSA